MEGEEKRVDKTRREGRSEEGREEEENKLWRKGITIACDGKKRRQAF